MKQKILVYKCPKCGKRYEAHIHGEVFEAKTLFCATDGYCMAVAQNIITKEIESAPSQTTGT